VKKATEENQTSKEQTEKMSQAAKAYKLFSDGKSPVDVAIIYTILCTLNAFVSSFLLHATWFFLPLLDPFDFH
jgi:hypothetical protein